jgi:4-alpha-glucanotransferase
VTTHDLPPTAGYLAGEHVELRRRLGLLTRTIEEELAVDEADREAVLDLVRSRSLLPDDATERQVVEALHKLLTRTPSRLLGVSLCDAVGDRRAQNQPGTSTEYPNWKLPLTDGSGMPVLLEDLVTRPRALSLAQAVSRRR